MFWKLMGTYDWIQNTFNKEIRCTTIKEQYLLFTWASFKQVWLVLVQIMQNLAGGYVPKDLTHSRELWMPCPWKHSSPGWTGLWAPRSSWRCTGWLQESWSGWPLQIPSNVNRSGILWCFSARLWQVLWVFSCYSSSPSGTTDKWS